MVGMPHETRSYILDTIKLNAKVKPKAMHVSVFYPYPGTKAYEMCRRDGLLTDKYSASIYEDSVLAQSSITPEQVQAMQKRFEPLVRTYSRCHNMPTPLDKLGEKLIDFEVMATTDQRVLRIKNKLSRKKAPGERVSGGTCYVVKDGKVQVWDKK
jgi:hypothetical protein